VYPVDDAPHRFSRRLGRRRRGRLQSMLVLAVAMTVVGGAGVVVAGRRQVDRIERIPDLGVALSDDTTVPVENFLLVGSDSREGADPSDPDFGGIGDASTVTGRRSDTIMVLRRDRNGGPAALLSIPRDLWVEIPGHGSDRINSAYSSGPAVLIATVQEALDLPIHHYVEVDFQGFKSLVDAIGGVEICFDHPARDAHTGLDVAEPGCRVLDGVQALAYARSRYYEELVDGEWTTDPRSDLGRVERQQQFVNTALHAALDQVKSNPLDAGDVFASTTGALRLDDELDPLAAAGALRDAVADGLATYSLPVDGAEIEGKAVLKLGKGGDQLLAYFRGVGVAPDTS
jgi:LCP family protein required for cell wall assembly